VIIEPRLWPDQGRQINHLAAGRGFGEAHDAVARGVVEVDEIVR
jgi:hypothetical protein